MEAAITIITFDGCGCSVVRNSMEHDEAVCDGNGENWMCGNCYDGRYDDQETMDAVINEVRSFIDRYDDGLDVRGRWFIEEREHSVFWSLENFVATAMKLNDSDNYSPTDEEQNYWNFMAAEAQQLKEQFADWDNENLHAQLTELIENIYSLYEKFNGRICDNGEELYEAQY